MALQYSVPVNNARLNAFEATVGTGAKLLLYSGTPPANCAAAATGTLLAQMDLASDWISAAAAGVISKIGTWQDTSANATGTAGWFGIWDTAIANRGAQGTVTATGAGGDITLDNTSVAATQSVTISTFTITTANM